MCLGGTRFLPRAHNGLDACANLLFIYLFGNLFYFRNQMEHENKVSLAKSFGAGIAHEMRNPLSGLLTSIDVIQSILPNPKSGDHKGQYALSNEDVIQLREVGDEAMEIIHSGNETIDLLLTSIDENRVSRSTFKNIRRKRSLRIRLSALTTSAQPINLQSL